MKPHKTAVLFLGVSLIGTHMHRSDLRAQNVHVTASDMDNALACDMQ